MDQFRKFDMVMCLDPPELLSIYNFMLLKFNIVANCHLENIKNMISQIIWTSFSRILVC